MVIKQGKSKLSIALMFIAPLMFTSVLHAAKPIDLSQQNVSILQTFISAPITKNAVKLQETSRSTDMNETLHIRFQQTYTGYPVWGADGVMHVPMGDGSKASLQSFIGSNANKGSMDGTLYENLNADLAKTPTFVFSQSQAQKALDSVKANFQHKVGGPVKIKEEQSQLIVFIDDNNQAHWAYHISFYVDPVKFGELPQKPNLIVDAVTFSPYQQWDEIQTVSDVAKGGGFGGNIKMGKLIYDGAKDHLSKLRVTREDDKCNLQNDDVVVKGYDSGEVVSYPCKATDPDNNNVYWNGELEAVNDGYSPPNDALFGGAVIKDMYEKWYDVPVLTRNGKPMLLVMVVHDHIDNAYWDGSKMTFGDGITMFYPLTSLGVAAHEISHGFTQQHSNLRYYGQSGGMNEAFSDMAAQAAEQFAYGKVSWQIGGEIFKDKDRSLRYLDQPSKDCNGRKPGTHCSIDTASQYTSFLDVHYSSGVYNHFFYILGTSKGWNAKKAFDVMLHANSNYWTSNASFVQAACGVVKATKDLKYDVEAVKKAFADVEIKLTKC